MAVGEEEMATGASHFALKGWGAAPPLAVAIHNTRTCQSSAIPSRYYSQIDITHRNQIEIHLSAKPFRNNLRYVSPT